MGGALSSEEGGGGDTSLFFRCINEGTTRRPTCDL
jgi:hypothetical protein